MAILTQNLDTMSIFLHNNKLKWTFEWLRRGRAQNVMGKSKPHRPLAVNTGEIILSALKKLMKNTGWTARTIIKFIKIEYRISDPALGGKVSRALKKGVKLGMLRIDHGRYRLNDISELARPVKSNQIRATNHLSLRLQSPKASRAPIMGQYKPKKNIT